MRTAKVGLIDLLPDHPSIPDSMSADKIIQFNEKFDSGQQNWPEYNPIMPKLEGSPNRPRGEFGEVEPYSVDINAPVDLLPDFHNQFPISNLDDGDIIQS